MELEERFKNIQLTPTENSYSKLLLDAKTNSSLYLEILFSYINYLTEHKNYDLIISTLEEAINEDIIQERSNRLKLVNKLVTVLLKIEDFLKLKQALDQRYDLLTKESEFVMQKFYYAVCHEGLDDFQEAIHVLEDIPDNISNQNLVNKYLKLAMLNLKIDNLEAARNHLQRAKKFDPKMTNPIFLLAECDLFYAEKSVLKALDKYQDYLIKTKNKYRYLDRYINLNIEINNLAEAYSFYQLHLKTMEKVLSKQSRLLFYRASIRLLKTLKNEKELAYITSLMQEIEHSLTPINNVYDFTINYLENSFNKSFLKERDIIHHQFSELAKTQLFEKLVYVKIIDEKVKLLHYTKGLLLEKELLDPYLTNNVYFEIRANSYKNVYDSETIWSVNNDLYLSDNTAYIFVAKLRDFEYVVAYTSETKQFYNVKKLFDMNQILLKKHLSSFSKYGFNHNIIHNLYQIMDSLDYGVFLLKENTLHLLNPYAKKLLETNNDYLSFEDFQANLVKNIYVDQLIIEKNFEVKYQSKKIKTIKFTVFQDEMDLYLLASESKKIYEANKKFKDFNELVDKELVEEGSLILINIRNYHEVIHGYNYNRYLDVLESIYQVIRENARNHFDSLFQEGMDNLYLLLKTKDKRVIKRITESIQDQLHQDVDIRISSINLKDKVKSNDLADLKFLNSLTQKELKYLEDNKNYRFNKEVSKTILKNAERMLKENNVRLTYEPIVNWQTNTYKYLYVDVLEKKILGNKDSLKRVIRANNLEIAWNNLLLNQLAKEIKQTNFQGVFVMDLAMKTYLDKLEMQKIQKKLNGKGFNKVRMKFLIDYQEFKEYNTELTDSNNNIVFANLFSNFKFQDIKNLNFVDSVIVTHQELENSYSDYFLNVLNDFSVEIIYNHGTQNLTKSFLSNKAFILVMGEAYGKYEFLREIKQLED